MYMYVLCYIYVLWFSRPFACDLAPSPIVKPSLETESGCSIMFSDNINYLAYHRVHLKELHCIDLRWILDRILVIPPVFNTSKLMSVARLCVLVHACLPGLEIIDDDNASPLPNHPYIDIKHGCCTFNRTIDLLTEFLQSPVNGVCYS